MNHDPSFNAARFLTIARSRIAEHMRWGMPANIAAQWMRTAVDIADLPEVSSRDYARIPYDES